MSLGPFFEVFWPVLKFGIPILLIIALLRWGLDKIEELVLGPKRHRRTPRRSRKEIRAERGRLSREKGLAFEAELAQRFRAAGWKVEETDVSGDNGVDLIVSNGTRRYAIQAKLHKQNVGVDAVQAVFTGKAYHRCDVAVLVAPGGVTDQARETADKLGVLIWGRTELERALPKAVL